MTWNNLKTNFKIGFRSITFIDDYGKKNSQSMYIFFCLRRGRGMSIKVAHYCVRMTRKPRTVYWSCMDCITGAKTHAGIHKWARPHEPDYPHHADAPVCPSLSSFPSEQGKFVLTVLITCCVLRLKGTCNGNFIDTVL